MDCNTEDIEFEFNEMLLIISANFVRQYPSLMRFSKLKAKPEKMPKWVSVENILTLTSFLEYNFDDINQNNDSENVINRYHIFDKSEESDYCKIKTIRMLDYFELHKHLDAFFQQSVFPYISISNCDTYLYETLKKISICKNLDKISGNW